MGLKDEFEQSLELQNTKIKALAKTLSTVWNNQVSLEKSINLLEEEFCVLGRITIPKINEILLAIDSEDLITEETINTVFLSWNKFRQRSDFKQHFVPWFLGKPLEELPPPPKEEAKEEEPSDAPSQEAEGATEFGGDYDEGQNSSFGDPADPKEQSESTEESSQTTMP